MIDIAAAIERLEDQRERHPDAEVYAIPENGDYDHRVVEESLLYTRICTRHTAEQAAAWLTEVRPPGNRHDTWSPTEVPEVPCEDRPDTHRHVVVEC